MNYSHEVEKMCVVKKGPHHGPAPIPEEGKWVKSYADLAIFPACPTAWAGAPPSRAPAS